MNLKDLIKNLEDDYINEEELTKTEDLYNEYNNLKEVKLGDNYIINTETEEVYKR